MEDGLTIKRLFSLCPWGHPSESRYEGMLNASSPKRVQNHLNWVCVYKRSTQSLIKKCISLRLHLNMEYMKD